MDTNFSTVEEEFIQMNREVDKININLKDKSHSGLNIRSELADSHLNFDNLLFEEGDMLDILNINLGSADIPRFSCADHNDNNSVRSAIARHPLVCENLKQLTSFCVMIRNNTVLNNIFKELRCRLRIENNTRWGSAFLVLEMIKKAYDRNAFIHDETLELPVHIDIIEMYLMILLPSYKFNISFQSNRSTIGDVIPRLKNLIHQLEKIKMKVPIHGQQLINLLVEEYETRFMYELNSKVYKVKKF